MNQEIEDRIVDEIFAASEAYENLLVLADDIGIRLAGTPNEIKARDFLLDVLSRYGLDDVHTEAFEHRAWTPMREELSITAPIERKIVCRCAGLSPSTPENGVEGELCFLERGDRQELERHKEQVKGRFAVVPYYPFARQLKTPLAAEYGAIGLIETRNYPGSLQPARTCAFAKVGAIPVASISKEDAEYLRRLEERQGSVRVKLTLDSCVERKDSWNVVGTLRGTAHSEEHIVIGGHYDTWHVGPGAVDNASGVVAVLEAARGLAHYREHLPRTVKFVLFGVEESGLVGSWAYTHQHVHELEDTILMINNDVGGRPRGIGISGFDDLKPPLDEVAKRVRIAGEDLPLFGVSVGGPGWGSDHFPFVAHGIPTIGLSTEPINPEDRLYGHTRSDTPDKVYKEGLTECAAINAQIIFQISNLPTRPAQQKTQDELEEIFEKHSFMETLDLLDMWPPEHVKQRYFSFD
jgi:carboxypeptidase Q